MLGSKSFQSCQALCACISKAAADYGYISDVYLVVVIHVSLRIPSWIIDVSAEVCACYCARVSEQN